MIQKFLELIIKTNGQRLYDFTGQIHQWIIKNNFNSYDTNKLTANFTLT